MYVCIYKFLGKHCASSPQTIHQIGPCRKIFEKFAQWEASLGDRWALISQALARPSRHCNGGVRRSGEALDKVGPQFHVNLISYSCRFTTNLSLYWAFNVQRTRLKTSRREKLFRLHIMLTFIRGSNVWLTAVGVACRLFPGSTINDSMAKMPENVH